MKKTLIFGGIIAICAVFFSINGVAKAAAKYLVYFQTDTATSTVTYMTPGTATTTLSYSSDGVEKGALYVQFTASTSVATLAWTNQFSNNNIDWFEEDIYGSTIGVSQVTIEHASTTVTHRWTPGNTIASTSRKTLIIPSTPSKYTRFNFSLPIGSTNGAIWAQTANDIRSSY